MISPPNIQEGVSLVFEKITVDKSPFWGYPQTIIKKIESIWVLNTGEQAVWQRFIMNRMPPSMP
jgi:hypothetical protein